ncbi:MAG: hypothetical protein RLZZ156_1817 [Deinococcota bacterium]|jgi:7-alpha-hydroxysteroid dehydrogenase
MLLLNRTAIVYGASGAVGAAVSEAFAREGAFVVLAARTQGPLDSIHKRISDAGGKSVVLPVDATSPEDIERHLQIVSKRYGNVNLMFNATSWADTQGTVLTEMPFENFLMPVRIALTTWFYSGTILARHMAQHGGGTILGITANAGRQAFSSVGGFGVACASVEHFLRQLAAENGPHQVRVCWVRSPGSPDASGVREAWELFGLERAMTFEEVHREFAKDTPLRRIAGLMEVANAAVLLASDLASSMTGTMANATGGAQVD